MSQLQDSASIIQSSVFCLKIDDSAFNIVQCSNNSIQVELPEKRNHVELLGYRIEMDVPKRRVYVLDETAEYCLFILKEKTTQRD